MRVSYLPAVAMFCVLARGNVSAAASEHGTTLTSDVTSPTLPRRLLRTAVTTPVVSVPVEGTPTLADNATQAKEKGADDSSDDSEETGKEDENDSSDIGKEGKDDSSDDPSKGEKACF